MASILGIDPGGTTGVATYDLNSQEVSFQEVEGGTYGFTDWWHFGRPYASAGWIVCESFRLDDRTAKPDLTPVEIIGYLKGSARVTKFQTPGQAKALITNAVLKRAGLYPPRGQVRGGHSTDAARHALYYAVTELKDTETIERLWPK